MAFGQQSGPPATGKQVQELLSLLQAAGHSDFRDARGPMGFTQRQAGGKFTRDEADAFIEQLQAQADLGDGSDGSGEPPEPAPRPKVAQRPATTARTAAARPARGRPSGTQAADADLADVPAEVLAAELQRRGWIVVEP